MRWRPCVVTRLVAGAGHHSSPTPPSLEADRDFLVVSAAEVRDVTDRASRPLATATDGPT